MVSFSVFLCRDCPKSPNIFTMAGVFLAKATRGVAAKGCGREAKRGRCVPVWALCRQLFIDLELLPYSKYQRYFFWLLGSGQVSSLLFTGAHPGEAVPWGQVRPAQPGGVN